MNKKKMSACFIAISIAFATLTGCGSDRKLDNKEDRDNIEKKENIDNPLC